MCLLLVAFAACPLELRGKVDRRTLLGGLALLLVLSLLVLRTPIAGTFGYASAALQGQGQRNRRRSRTEVETIPYPGGHGATSDPKRAILPFGGSTLRGRYAASGVVQQFHPEEMTGRVVIPAVTCHTRAMSVDVHLVVGSTGAGKSTFARRLARECGGVCFVVDEWMQRLFHPDRPEAAGYDWYAPRIERSTEMIWTLVPELVRTGTPSVLEIGLTQRAAREAFYQRVGRAGLSLKLHAVEAPAEVRWQRVEARNRERGATFALEVTRGMFDFVEAMWQPPDDDELRTHAGERVDTSAPARQPW